MMALRASNLVNVFKIPIFPTGKSSSCNPKKKTLNFVDQRSTELMLTYHFFLFIFEFENVSELSLDQKACLERNIERFKVQYFFRIL